MERENTLEWSRGEGDRCMDGYLLFLLFVFEFLICYKFYFVFVGLPCLV